MAPKSKPRTKSGAAPGAPKPKIEPRKTPFLRRAWVRRIIAAVLAAVALWVALFVWGRVSRSSALRSYNKKLYTAARPFLQDIQQGPNSMQQVVTNFKNGTINSKALATSAAQWANDFQTAGQAIVTLKPPHELKGAQQDLLISLADYIGVANFYMLVQKQSDLAASIPATLKTQKKAATDQLTQLEQQVLGAQARADAAYSASIGEITDLSAKWHVKITNPFPQAPTTQSSQPGQ